MVGIGCFGLPGGFPWGFGLSSFDVVFPPVGVVPGACSPLVGPPVVVPPVVVPPIVVPPVVVLPVVPPVVPPVGAPLPVLVPAPVPVVGAGVCWMAASLARYCSTILALVSGVSSGALRISCSAFFCWLDSRPTCGEHRERM
jgi:hypothetical protein